ASAAHGGSRSRILLRQERGSSERPGRQARLHSQPFDQEPRAQTRAEEALVPQRTEMADRMRGTHQRGQAATRARSLPLQRRCRNEALGRARRHRRQHRQHRSHESKPTWARRSPRRVLFCGNQLTSFPETSILRRKVASLIAVESGLTLGSPKRVLNRAIRKTKSATRRTWQTFCSRSPRWRLSKFRP